MSDKPQLRFNERGDEVLIFWRDQLILRYPGRNSEDVQEFAATLRVTVVEEHPRLPSPHLRAEWGADSSARLFLDERPIELRHRTRVGATA